LKQLGAKIRMALDVKKGMSAATRS